MLTDATSQETTTCRTVGVLGGMGPEATLDFFAKVLARTQAATDQQHLRLIIDNNPAVPNRNDAVSGAGISPGPALAAMARGLEGAGAEFLVMVCNAAHAFQDDITGATSVPFVSIIEETVRATMRIVPEVGAVGVLAAAGCLDAGLYQRAFAGCHVEVLVPTDDARARFMELLYRVKAGDKGDEVRSGMQALAWGLIDAGAQAIIAGCTEVPLVLTAADLRMGRSSGASSQAASTSGEAVMQGTLPVAGTKTEVPLIDSTDVLVEATIAYALGRRPLPGRGSRGP